MCDSSLKKLTVSSLFWKLFEKGGRAIVELTVQIVMARILSPKEFGALAIMLVFVNIGNVIVTSGLNTALVQADEIDKTDLSTVFWLSFGVSLILFVAVFAFAPAIAAFYAIPEIVWPMRSLGFLLLVTAFNSVQVAIVQRRLQLRKVFNATITAVIISGLFGVSAALLGAGLWALVLQQLVYQISNCFVLGLQVKWFLISYSMKRKHEITSVTAGNCSSQVYWIKVISRYPILLSANNLVRPISGLFHRVKSILRLLATSLMARYSLLCYRRLLVSVQM